MIEVEKQGLRPAKQSDNEVSKSSQAVRDLARLTLRRSFTASLAKMAAAVLELERRSVAFLKQEETRSKR